MNKKIGKSTRKKTLKKSEKKSTKKVLSFKEIVAIVIKRYKDVLKALEKR